MQVFRGIPPARARTPCALTIGNFDGVHRGHQAMLALLTNEARHRQLPSCVVMFEPHPRDFFAQRLNKPELAPARVSTLRDAVMELQRCGVDRVVVLRFDEALASMPAQDFIHHVLHQGLQARYVLVGDDFRYGAQRAGDYAFLDAQGAELGFEVARMMSYEVHGLRPFAPGAAVCLERSHHSWSQVGPGVGVSHPEPAIALPPIRRHGHFCGAGPWLDLTALASRGQLGRAPHGRRRRPPAFRGALPGLALDSGD